MAGEFSEIFGFISRTATVGGVGIWSIVVLLLLGLWKGFPGVLDAWSNRLSKEAERTDREIARLEAHIVAADNRHDECIKGQAELRSEVSRLNRIIDGMINQMRQIQISAARTDGVDLPAPIVAMMQALDRIPGRGE